METTYSVKAQTAQIRGLNIDLKDTNVVLVDNADAPDRTTVVSALYTKPKGDGGFATFVNSIVGRDSRLYEFLRCDVPLPDGSDAVSAMLQRLVSTGCTEMGRK